MPKLRDLTGQVFTRLTVVKRGETKTASEFARQYGVKVVTVFGRLGKNWSIEDTLTKQPRQRRARA